MTYYESTSLEITLATVYRRSAKWIACCIFGPGDDDYDEEPRRLRETAEAVALRHAEAMADAL